MLCVLSHQCIFMSLLECTVSSVDPAIRPPLMHCSSKEGSWRMMHYFHPSIPLSLSIDMCVEKMGQIKTCSDTSFHISVFCWVSLLECTISSVHPSNTNTCTSFTLQCLLINGHVLTKVDKSGSVRDLFCNLSILKCTVLSTCSERGSGGWKYRDPSASLLLIVLVMAGWTLDTRQHCTLQNLH